MVAVGFSVGLTVAMRKLRAAQRAVLGDGSQDLVAHAAHCSPPSRRWRSTWRTSAPGSTQRMDRAETRLDGAVAHRALVRYDAYGEMSGRQSTSIALLDANRSGIVLSSIHHRDTARLYAKQIRNGQPEIGALTRGERGDPARSAGRRAPASPTTPPGRDQRADAAMRVAYLGPEGTFTQAAALSAPAADTLELVAHETIHDTVLAVRDGSVERAVVPIENSLEGSVNVTLDALVLRGRAGADRRRDGARRRAVPDRPGAAAARTDRGRDLTSTGDRSMSRLHPRAHAGRRGS